MAMNIEQQRALAMASARMRMAQQSNTGYAEDVTKSLGSGLARGAADLIGLPGTLGDLGQAGFGYAMRKGYELATGGEQPNPQGGLVERFFAGPQPDNPMPQNPLSGDAMRGYLSKATGGRTDYQPQTVPGEYARTIGEFGPAMASGPGGLVRKTAMSVIPAVSSETAGQLTKDTAAEPYARLGGALVGGGLSAGRVNATKEAARGAPSPEKLKATTDRLYEMMRNAGITYDAGDYARTVQSAADEIVKSGFRPVGPSKTAFEWLDELSNQIGKAPDFADIDGIIKTLGEEARGALATPDKKPLGKALNIIRDKLMDFEANAAFTSRSGVSRDTLNKVRSGARDLAKRNIKNRMLTEVLDNADNYAAGQEAGIRNGINNLLRSKRGNQIFSAEEKKALREVSQGRKGLRTLSRFGFDVTKLSGNATFLPAIGAVGAGQLAGAPAGAGLALAGTAAKALSPYLTNKAFQEAMGAIRTGKLADKSAMNAVRAERVKQNIRRLLAVEPSIVVGGQALDSQQQQF